MHGLDEGVIKIETCFCATKAWKNPSKARAAENAYDVSYHSRRFINGYLARAAPRGGGINNDKGVGLDVFLHRRHCAEGTIKQMMKKRVASTSTV